MKNGDIILPGKIAVESDTGPDCVVYLEPGKKRSFKAKRDDIQYSGFTWLNRQDLFLGMETIPGETRDDYRINLAKFDLTGNLLEKVYESEKGELAWLGYPSRDDRYLLFTTHHLADPERYPFETLSPMLTLKIMDLREKKVIESLDSIGRSPGFECHESPWLYTGKRFVYSLSGKTKLVSEGKAINPMQDSIAGVYVYDLDSHTHTLIAPEGNFAIASPVTNSIAYVKEKVIHILEMNNTRGDREIYELEGKQKVRSIHWTPDGKYIYLCYFQSAIMGDAMSMQEKLIDINTGQEVPFKKLGHGFSAYTWK